tara:strand:- start:4 stop:492 length:489 start_codon:yes stop_codon:yes gene_type:complete
MPKNRKDLSEEDIARAEEEFRKGREEFSSGHLKGHGVMVEDRKAGRPVGSKTFTKNFRSKVALVRLIERCINDVLTSRMDIEIAKTVARLVEIQKGLLVVEKGKKAEETQVEVDKLEEILEKTPKSSRLKVVQEYLRQLNKKIEKKDEEDVEDTSPEIEDED